MIRAVVFDLWNTLIHSPQGDPFQHIQRILGSGKAHLFPAFKREAMDRPHADATAFLATWQARLDLSQEEIQPLADTFRASAADATCFPETREALRDTRKVARLALLSNTQNFETGFLERLELTSFLPHRFLSSELGCMKPDPDIFLRVQRKLGLFPGEIAMVGDSWRDDITGALDAGWTAIWINRKGLAQPEVDPEAWLVELRDLSSVPTVIENLQAGARCSTCLG